MKRQALYFMAVVLVVALVFFIAKGYYNYTHISIHPCPDPTQVIVIKCDIPDSIVLAYNQAWQNRENKICLNHDCSLKTQRGQHTGFHLYFPDGQSNAISIGKDFGISVGEFENIKAANYPNLLLSFDSICAEDLTDGTPIFIQEMKNWSRLEKDLSVDNYLFFEPYSESREVELAQSNDSGINDNSPFKFNMDFKRVGGWFVINSTSKVFCI